jgi:cytochrome P450
MSSVHQHTATSSDRFDPDLTDLTLFDHGPPHETFRRLREEQPVHWNCPSPGGSSTGFWSLTRYDDIERASKDWETI